MFYESELVSLNLFDNNQNIGIVKYNPDFDFSKKTTRPFIRNTKQREIITIGIVNYMVLETFIINSLKDYYAKLTNEKNVEEKNKMIREYQQLYYLWQKIISAKQVQDVNLNSYYDDLVYRLYLLGYRN